MKLLIINFPTNLNWEAQPFPLPLLLALSNFFWIPLWIAGVNAWECESYTTPCVWDKAVRSFLHSMYLRLLPKPCMLLSIVSSNKTMSRPKIACTWDYWVIDYPTLAIIAVWRPANGFEVGRRWTPFCNKWAPCSTPTNSSKWMIPSNSPSRTCAHFRWVLVANASWNPAIPPWHPSRKRSCLCSSLRMETNFAAPEPSSRPKPDLTNTPTGTGSKEAEGSKQNMQ